ncbi:hypothetical protein NL676_005931 [Syzygium grande]|nr:hypothetical protein NL676_005931 [Syzygium grande]
MVANSIPSAVQWREIGWFLIIHHPPLIPKCLTTEEREPSNMSCEDVKGHDGKHHHLGYCDTNHVHHFVRMRLAATMLTPGLTSLAFMIHSTSTKC